MLFNLAILSVFHSNLKENQPSKLSLIRGLFSEFFDLGLSHHICLHIRCTHTLNVFSNINLHQNENTWAINWYWHTFVWGSLRCSWPILNPFILCLAFSEITHTPTQILIYLCCFPGSYCSHLSNKTKKTMSCVSTFQVIWLIMKASADNSTLQSVVGKNTCTSLLIPGSFNTCSKITKPTA